MSARDFISFAAERRARVEAALAVDAAEPGLQAAARDALLAGGKRLRPLAVYAAGEAFGARPDSLTPAAAAVECVHAASLALDDLPCMDDATLRRGRPALHRAHGEANAILAAVGLLCEAHERLAGADWKPAVRAEAVAILARAAGLNGLSAGQAFDLRAPRLSESTSVRERGRMSRSPDALASGRIETLEATHRLKTAALFVAALDLGGLCGGAGRAERELLRAYGRDLGLAYQVVDDHLDAAGDPARTGKDAGRDAGKTTFHSLLGSAGSLALADELTAAAVAHLAPLGRRAERLRALAQLLVKRDN